MRNHWTDLLTFCPDGDSSGLNRIMLSDLQYDHNITHIKMIQHVLGFEVTNELQSIVAAPPHLYPRNSSECPYVYLSFCSCSYQTWQSSVSSLTLHNSFFLMNEPVLHYWMYAVLFSPQVKDLESWEQRTLFSNSMENQQDLCLLGLWQLNEACHNWVRGGVWTTIRLCWKQSRD